MTIGTKLTQGWEAEIFEWSDGDQPKVLKLYYEGGNPDSPRTEMAISRAVCAEGGPAPHVYGDVLEIDGRFGFVMERIDGRELQILITQRPWRVDSLARSMGRLHASLHEHVAPTLRPLKERLAETIPDAALLTEHEKSAALRLLAELPDGDHVCHGDFHPRNLMVAADDTKTVVIDWGNTTRGDPVADVARSHLLMKLGWIGELSPLLGLVRRLADRLNRIYTDTYFDASGRERRQMARWLTVMAAARLEEAQPDEQAHATADLVRSGLREYTR